MFGALILPAAVGAVLGSTRTGQRVWPKVTLAKGALAGLGLGFIYSVLRSKSGISGNIDMQRKFFSPTQGARQVLYQRSISAGGLFDRIRLT